MRKLPIKKIPTRHNDNTHKLYSIMIMACLVLEERGGQTRQKFQSMRIDHLRPLKLLIEYGSWEGGKDHR